MFQMESNSLNLYSVNVDASKIVNCEGFPVHVACYESRRVI